MSGARHRNRPFEAAVVVGSQGALDSFRAILSAIPPRFPAAVIFDLHRSERSGVTEQILRRRGGVPIETAQQGAPVEPGVVYVAPSDRQLEISDARRFRVRDAANGTGHPSADALLSSAACVFGSGLIAIVLSGRLDGGARGVREVRRHGGRVLVEDPSVAAAPAMPMAALASGCVDFALTPERIGDALVALCAATGAAELFRVRLNAGVSS